MAKKQKKAAKKNAPKKAGSQQTPAAEDEKARIEAITQWLRKVD